ncbi:MAG: hypothetical protein R3E77_00615 [Steroidobacteraceae bacterium]
MACCCRTLKSVLAVVTFSVLGFRTSAVSAAEDLPAARAAIIGPAIARGADFTVHTPEAVAQGGQLACRRPQAGGRSLADIEAQNRAAHQRWQEEVDAIEAEKKANYRSFTTRQISLDEKLRRDAALNERRKQADARQYEAQSKLQTEHKAQRAATSDYLPFIVQHAPADSNAMIIPLEGGLPSQAYVANLNRALAPFLAGCGDRDYVTVAHVYRDHFPAGVDVERKFEKPIAAFSYTLTGGVLKLDPRRNKPGAVRLDDPLLTLAGARATLAAHHREDARARGEYRKDFAYASRRKPGIVYKLDAYWAQYKDDPSLDVVRRIFDGDFKGQAGSAAHKSNFHLFGDMYSRRCTSEIPKFTVYQVPYSEITATRTYLDGHVEHDYRTAYEEVPIDARFSPQWGEYRRAALFYVASAMAGIASEVGNFATASKEQLINAIAKGTRISMLSQFLRNHPCGTASLTQLRENLVRAANGRPSLQEEGSTAPTAARESDPPTQP